MKYLSWNEFIRLVLTYTVFTRNDDGSWTAEVTVLPGCVTWGETRAEAAIMAEDAIQGWLVTALRFGDEIPLIDGYGLAYLDDRATGGEMAYVEAVS